MAAERQDQPKRPTRFTLVAELRSIWLNTIKLSLRKFNYLSTEIADATWRRFLLTILTTLVVASGLYHLALGLSYQGAYEKQLRIQFNLAGYWIVETLWSVGSAALIDIPIILLVAYLTYHWLSHTREEKTLWIHEAHMLAITWALSAICIQAIFLLEGATREAVFRNMNIISRALQEHRYSPIFSYVFSGLLTAPIIAYRYNLRLHGNKILNGIQGRQRWMLLAFQFIMLEGGILLVSKLVLNLPVMIDLHQTLSRVWLP